jgi:hypothetical protein
MTAPEPADRVLRDGRWTRRSLLLAAAAAGGGGLAACSVRAPQAAAPSGATVTLPGETVAGPTVTVTETAGPGPAPAPVGVLPEQPEPWTVLPGEVLPACKQAAVDFLVAAMSFDDRGRDDDALAERMAPTGQSPEVALPLLGVLPGEGPGALEIRYAQYGGLSPAEDRASQMVVGDQLLLDADGRLVRRPFAADVRLSLDGDRWVVTSAVPAFPDPPLPPLTPAVQALLEDSRFDLPGIAAADLRSGVVQESVATGLLRLVERYTIDIHVFYSAHPVNVFATTRASAHTVGRAVDVWALNGVPVIRQDSSPWRGFMEMALEVGATDIGGPAELQPAASYFTDRVHQDHVHLGFPLAPGGRV